MYMFKYILKRFGLMLMTFAIIMVVCFVLVKSVPMVTTVGIGESPEKIKALISARGYDKPVLEQLYWYVYRIVVEGDWGVGINMPEFRYQPVWDSFIISLPPTVLINLYSVILAVPLGLALGIFAALKKNRWQDYLISTLVMVVISVPSYVYAFVIQVVFCFQLQWFPLTMNAGYDYFTSSMFLSMFPAVLALSFGSIAGYARFSRAELTEVLTSDFMLLARTKGLTRAQATVRHALKNSMVPIFPMIIGEFISVMSGSLIIEGIFSIPGVGRLYLNAVTSLDYDFFMLLSAFYTFIGLAAGIVIDISYGFIDPRIRMGAR